MKDFIEMFRKPSAHQLAQRELEEAQRQLLEAQSAAEYAANLAKYHADRIRRLRTYLLTETQ